MEISLYDAKTQLSKLINMLESKDEEVVYICKHNKPVAQITLIKDKKVKRVGAAEGLWKSTNLNEFNSLEISEENIWEIL